MQQLHLEPILIATLIGLMIGMQRSLTYILKNEAVFIGSRTFAMLSLSGYISAWMESFIPYSFLAGLLFCSLFLALTYYFKVVKLSKIGITTQVAGFITFFLGAMVYWGLKEYAIAISVLLVLLLELKPTLLKLEQKIEAQDIQAVVLLLTMSFIILPILPDRFIGPYHLFNPYKTWFMAIVIASLSFVGYVAIRLFGHNKGILITGAAGGLISSTAVTFTLAKLFPRNSNLLHLYAAGIAIAWSFMFFRVFIEALLIYPNLAKLLALPYLLTGVVGTIYVLWLLKKTEQKSIEFHNETLEKNPLQLSQAIKFALIFGLIYGVVAYAKSRYGDLGVYIISALSGISDVDAITLSLSQMSKNSALSIKTAMIGIVLASYVNTLVKLCIAFWLGGRELGFKLTLFSLLLTITLFGSIILLTVVAF